MTRLLTIVAMLLSLIAGQAQEQGTYVVTAYGNASSGDFSPYFIGSLTQGKYTQKNSGLIDACVTKPINDTLRVSYGFGAEGVMGYSSSNEYEFWQQWRKAWSEHLEGPSPMWLQQLYADVKYRKVFATLGMKSHGSPLLNNKLSSGDLVQSGNARPIPELRMGLIDYCDIPFTYGWVQIQGELSLGVMADNDYMKRHYNYYSNHIHTGAAYSYRRCFFRFAPRQRLTVTAGMQAASFFGGKSEYYQYGEFIEEKKFKCGFKTLVNVIFPFGENGEDYYEGSTFGSWDCQATYELKSGALIKAYFQGPWEDGSSIGRMNKLDGIWGIEYQAAKPDWISGIVIEYIDFRDQCGPVHFSPEDAPGTTLDSQATGRDNYYNNYYYNSYANYGMCIGTPFLVSPLYNLDGYTAFKCNRANGFHVGVMGQITHKIDYRMLVSYQRGLGTYERPFYKPRTCTAVMLEAGWDASRVAKGLSARMQCALDQGDLRGNNFGVSIAVSYSGKL